MLHLMHQAKLLTQSNRFAPGGDAQLAEDVSNVEFCRVFSDPHFLGNLKIAMSAGQPLQYFQFASGQVGVT